ncbi:MAG TPA: alternative ribosome rescue aminoacyl-tRNA hydrolase ArfB [Bacteroidota bacterium]
MGDAYLTVTPVVRIPSSEITFRTSRSGGPGGQNVNKLETRVEALFDVRHTRSLTEHQRSAVLEYLKNRIDSAGLLRVVAQESRSQSQNKEKAVERLTELLRKALQPRKLRLKTRPTRSAVKSRIQAKRHLSEKKRNRKSEIE